MTRWQVTLRVSENEDGTGADKFYTNNQVYTSRRTAGRAAKKWVAIHKEGRAPWFREARVYREGAERKDEHDTEQPS